MRVALEDFPGSPVVITVDARDGALLRRDRSGWRRLAEPRPLYGAPAHAAARPDGRAHGASTAGARESSGQRALDRLIRERPPLVDRRPAHRAAAARPAGSGSSIEEQGVTARLAAQIRLLAVRHPHALRAILREAAGVARRLGATAAAWRSPASGVGIPLPIHRRERNQHPPAAGSRGSPIARSVAIAGAVGGDPGRHCAASSLGDHRAWSVGGGHRGGAAPASSPASASAHAPGRPPLHGRRGAASGG